MSRRVLLSRWALVAICNALPWPLFTSWRARLYRLAGAKVGVGAKIYGQQLVGEPQNLRVEDHAFINARCVLDASGLITIGAGTLIGPGVSLLTTHHREDFAPEARPTTIGPRSWIGAGALVMPGCTLEGGSTVAAGTVLLGRFYEAGVYAGVPARLIRKADRDAPES